MYLKSFTWHNCPMLITGNKRFIIMNSVYINIDVTDFFF